MSTVLRRLVLTLLVLFLSAVSLVAEEPNRNVRFGLPSPAKADPKQREDYLIARPWRRRSGARRTARRHAAR